MAPSEEGAVEGGGKPSETEGEITPCPAGAACVMRLTAFAEDAIIKIKR